MSKYSVEIKEQAQEDLKRLLRSEPNAYSKALQLIRSRRISRKHRLVYEIHDTEVIVLVLAAYGHYEDK